MPGSMVFGDYVIEHGSDSDEGHGGGGGVIDAALGRSLVNVFLLLHAIEDSETSDLAATSNNHGTVEMDFSDDGNSLASRMRRQGRTLLGRSGRRRRNREANQSSGPP